MSRRIALRACHLYLPFREALAVVCSWVADTGAPKGTVSQHKSTTAFTLLLFGCSSTDTPAQFVASACTQRLCWVGACQFSLPVKRTAWLWLHALCHAICVASMISIPTDNVKCWSRTSSPVNQKIQTGYQRTEKLMIIQVRLHLFLVSVVIQPWNLLQPFGFHYSHSLFTDTRKKLKFPHHYQASTYDSSNCGSAKSFCTAKWKLSFTITCVGNCVTYVVWWAFTH